MVFYYTIRGGTCQNEHSHITLDDSDIICYMGRDKHENEYLIKYGWPGDVWFHVEGLSSAHVYFRLRDTSDVLEKVPSGQLPAPDLPAPTIYDMMQIVKNNSIQGCKLASCRIVYTPHSNLKKTFQMDAGTVTYHNTKLCYYGRCNKDKPRIKELEKTKTERVNVDFYKELKDNERKLIERNKAYQKQLRQQGTTTGIIELYDPVLEDVKSAKSKLNRQGDAQSGLDQGVAALESIGLGGGDDDIPGATKHYYPHVSGPDSKETTTTSTEPIWVQETNQRRADEPNECIRFLRERGYTNYSNERGNLDPSVSKIANLQRAWKSLAPPPPPPELDSQIISDDNIRDIRIEERQVLQAIFGEEVSFPTPPDGMEEDDCPLLNAIFPITSYEPPERYGLPPPLLLEVYVDNIHCNYPNEPPVLAVTGGGLSEALLHQLTTRIYNEALSKSQDEPGDPQIFNLITFVGDSMEPLIEEETEALKLKQEEALRLLQEKQRVLLQEKQRRAAEAAQKRQQQQQQQESSSTPPTSFHSQQERRAYAQQVLAQGDATTSSSSSDTTNKPKKKQYYKNTGVSDQKLIVELFS